MRENKGEAGNKEQAGGGRGLGSIKLTRDGKPSREVMEEAARLIAAEKARQEESVSAGPIDKVIELAFNPSREKLREVTIIDRWQGRTFPLIDTMNSLFLECIKIAVYRQSPSSYHDIFGDGDGPSPVFDVMGEYLTRTAQWQKSIAGKNLERATDIALAETEKSAEEEDQYPSSRGYED